MARPTLAEQYPDWPLRYVAFALAHGATDILAFREAQESRAAYNTWIDARIAEWRADRGIGAGYLTRPQLRDFESWLERRAEMPEPIAPIVDRVMADILSKQVGEARRTA